MSHTTPSNSQRVFRAIRTYLTVGALAVAPVAIAASPAGATVHVALPGTPTSVSATSNVDSSAVVSWHAPTSVGGAPISAYSIRYSSNGGRTWKSLGSPGSNLNFTVTGLSNGESYIFGVAAKNAGGVGAYSANSSPATPATAPSAPTKTKAVSAQDSMSSVSWAASSITGGAVISEYTVTASPSPSPSGATCTVSAPATTCNVTGLTNGTGYTFTVTAKNAAGLSKPSAPTASIVPSVVPGAPRNVSADTAQNQRATLHWTAPSSLGGALTLVDYSIQYSSDGGTTWNPVSPNASATATSYTVTGLVNGTSYLFEVAARNASGRGPVALSNAAIPSATTNAPTAVTATMVNHGATVSWTAPTTTNGANITGYNVKVISAVGGRTQQFNSTTPTEDITGLIDGTSYTFEVQAINASGAGTISLPSNAIVPVGPPSPPTAVSVIGSTWSDNNASATVWWLTGSSNGSIITGYAVTATDGSNSANDASCTTYGSSDRGYGRSCTVAGLTPGDPYSFTVAATNAIGTASTSTAGTVTDVTTSLVSAGNVAVTWSGPTSGLTPVSYLVKANDAANSTCTVDLGTTTCTLSNADLTSLAGYSVTVQAVDASGGKGLAGFSTNAPAASAAPTVIRGNTAVAVTWTQVSTTPVDYYVVTATDVTSPGADGDGSTCSVNQWNPPACTIGGLTNGDVYTFTVAAVNTYGRGASSLASATVTPSTVPDAPANIATSDDGLGNTTVSWTASNPEGSVVTRYTVKATDTTNSGTNGDGNTCTSSDPTDSCTITGLTEGDSYNFSVVATNLDGNSIPGVGSSGS